MNASRTIAFAATLLAAASACAAQLPASAGKWDANPVAWSFRDGAVDSSSVGGFAIYLDAPRAARVEVSATLTPASVAVFASTWPQKPSPSMTKARAKSSPRWKMAPLMKSSLAAQSPLSRNNF